MPRGALGAQLQPSQENQMFARAEQSVAPLVSINFATGERPPSLAEHIGPGLAADIRFEGVSFPSYAPPGRDAQDKRYEWILDEWLALARWIISTLFFFTSLLSLDMLICNLYRDCRRVNSCTMVERLRRHQALWGGPTPMPKIANHALITFTREDYVDDRRRLVGLLAVIINDWPRVKLPTPPPRTSTQEDFFDFERRVWVAFAQTWIDYIHRRIPFPLPLPKSLPPGFMPQL